MRLIDADTLIDTIAIIAKKFAKSDAQKALMGRIIYHLERKPEQVVRCKDCKYYGTRGCAMDTYAFDVVEEGFCSYGERKSERILR